MPLCNLIYLDPPWPHDNYSAETGSDRSTDNHYAPMTWDELEAFGAKLPAAPDCMLIMWAPKSLVVRASALLIKWGWDPLRTTSMIWLKMQGDKIWTGTGKRLRDQHESIILAVRGTIPPALPMWGSVLVAPVGEPQREAEGAGGDDRPRLWAGADPDRDVRPAAVRSPRLVVLGRRGPRRAHVRAVMPACRPTAAPGRPFRAPAGSEVGRGGRRLSCSPCVRRARRDRARMFASVMGGPGLLRMAGARLAIE